MTINEITIIITIALVIICFGGLFMMLLSDKKQAPDPSPHREDVYNKFMEE